VSHAASTLFVVETRKGGNDPWTAIETFESLDTAREAFPDKDGRSSSDVMEYRITEFQRRRKRARKGRR
jgi:hypothetical protein